MLSFNSHLNDDSHPQFKTSTVRTSGASTPWLIIFKSAHLH